MCSRDNLAIINVSRHLLGRRRRRRRRRKVYSRLTQ